MPCLLYLVLNEVHEWIESGFSSGEWEVGILCSIRIVSLDVLVSAFWRNIFRFLMNLLTSVMLSQFPLDT